MSKQFMILQLAKDGHFFVNPKLLEISRSGKQIALYSKEFYELTHLTWWYIDRMMDEDIEEIVITREFPSFVNAMPKLLHLDVDKMFEWHEEDIFTSPKNVDFQHLLGLKHLSMACNYLREVN